MKLRDHQRRGVKIATKNPRWCFWWDTGVGKTATLLSANLKAPVLVLCPLAITKTAWLKDYVKLFGDDWVCEDGEGFSEIVIATGSRKERQAALGMGGDFYVMNYEGALASQKEVLAKGFKTIIFDESTRLKADSGRLNRTQKLAYALSQQAERVYMLSGCPTPNRLLEYYHQVNICQPGLLPKTFYSFRARYFFQPRPHAAPWLWKIRPDTKEELLTIVAQCSSWLRKQDVLDLPPLTEEVHHVPLGSERKYYDGFLRDWVLMMEEGDVVASHAFTQLMKSRQLTSGIVKLSEAPEKWHTVGSSKLDYLASGLDEWGKDVYGNVKPVVVIAQFRYEIDRLIDALSKKRRPVMLRGGMTDLQRDAALDGFEDGTFDTLVMQPRTGSHGLNLQHCDTIIFSSLDYSYEAYYQIRGRIERMGQKNKMTLHYLLAEDTIDQEIYAALTQKESLTQEIVQDYKRRFAAV
jgi:SNF2 family DNA or RNA helicase